MDRKTADERSYGTEQPSIPVRKRIFPFIIILVAVALGVVALRDIHLADDLRAAHDEVVCTLSGEDPQNAACWRVIERKMENVKDFDDPTAPYEP